MSAIKGFITAFAMFTRIPMPHIEWKDENMKYMFVFFPFIAFVEGLLMALWFTVCERKGLNGFVFACVATLIPVLITGGIHLDGFMDCCDGLASHSDREKMLEILDDSRVGAFAVIGVVIYLILYFALMTCISQISQIYMLTAAFFLVRATAVVSIITNDAAKQSGLIYTFKNNMQKGITGLFSVVYILLSVGAAESFGVLTGIICVAAIVCCVLYFNLITVKKFGGITGDLIGWFISVAELAAVAAVCLGGLL